MDKAFSVFENYNMAIEESYDKIFSKSKAGDILKEKEEGILKQVDADLAIWAGVPESDLDGLTPRDYFAGLKSLEELEAHFRLGAKLCDKDLPETLVDKIKSFGNDGIGMLLKLASDSALIHHEDDFLIPLMAIKILGDWKVGGAVSVLMDVLAGCNEEDEAVIESIANTLVNIGNTAVDPILQVLENTQTIGCTEEYLISALAKIGRKNKSDEIYKCLKSMFLKMDNKVFGAICLADYDDIKVIQFLKGYVLKNWNSITRELFFEIKRTVEKLGGSMDDISLKFL